MNNKNINNILKTLLNYTTSNIKLLRIQNRKLNAPVRVD